MTLKLDRPEPALDRLGKPLTRCSVLVLAAWAAAPAAAQSAAIERVSVDTGGLELPDESAHVSISGDGRFVAFDSDSALVAGPAGGSFVYVRDRRAGTTELASVSLAGGHPNFVHCNPSISNDGRWVAFVSTANDLGPPDTNATSDVYLYDRLLKVTELISVSSAGAQSDGPCFYPHVSGDGRFVAFVAGGDTLVPGDVEGQTDVFVRDRVNGTTERVSVSTTGVGGNNQSGSVGNRVEQMVSDDGRWVAFVSWASNLVPNDTNGNADIFLHDRQTGVTQCVSATAGGIPGNFASWGTRMSPDGRFIGFASWASDLASEDTNDACDVFLLDRSSGALTRESLDSSSAQLAGMSAEVAVSADGSRVAFVSFAMSLAPGANGQVAHLFVRDRRLGTTRIASLAADGAFENGVSYAPELSADGATITFRSSSTNLVPLDTNQVTDAFVHDLRRTPPLIYCTGKLHSEGCSASSSSTGFPSASSGQAFLVRAADVLSGTTGFLVYAPDWQELPFQGGALCLAGRIRRTPAQLSGGSVACGGSFSMDFNAHIGSGVDPSLNAGASVAAQWWFRDPVDPFLSGLSNALLFYIQP